MPRQVFAGGPDSYYDSIGWNPRRPSRRRRRGNDIFDTGVDEDPFDSTQGEKTGTDTPATPTQPTLPTPISYGDYVGRYTLPAGRFENLFGDLLASQGPRLTNAPGVPTFEQMFEQFRKAQQFGRDQEIAGLGEAFGSRGARYGSDILQAQTNARSRFGVEDSVAANKFLMDLEGSRQNFLNLLMGGYGNASQLEEGRRALGETRAFADFIRQTGIPPLFGATVGYAGSSSPTSIVY